MALGPRSTAAAVEEVVVVGFDIEEVVVLVASFSVVVEVVVDIESMERTFPGIQQTDLHYRYTVAVDWSKAVVVVVVVDIRCQCFDEVEHSSFVVVEIVGCRNCQMWDLLARIVVVAAVVVEVVVALLSVHNFGREH
jgi:hypothetical protein